MKITDEEVEKYLIEIFSGSKLVYINNILFLFKQPDNEIKMKADLIYFKAFDRAVSMGILPSKDLEALMEYRHVFSEEDKTKLEKLNNQLKAQEVLLSKTVRIEANQKRIRDIIYKLKEEINDIEYKRISKLSMSAENKALEEKALYLCWCCVFVADEHYNYKRYWNSFSDLLNAPNLDLRNDILIEFLRFKSGIDTTMIRFIARHSLWRIRYVTSQKTSEALFGVPTSQYTNDMLSLSYWSNFYQNIYEMMAKDRPPDSLIEDDEALDAYMKSYYEERNREDASERSKSKISRGRGKLSAFDKEEVIVTGSNELYQDIKYDKPREAQQIKERVDLKKRTRRFR